MTQSEKKPQGRRARDEPGETLSVGGLRVSLECDHRRLMDRIRRRYAGFLAGGESPVHFRVTVTHRGTEESTGVRGWRVPEGRYASGEFRLDSPGLEGRIDIQRSRAQLRLASHFPVEDLDYFLRAVYALLAFEAEGLLFHAAGIIQKDRAYLFFGPSGSGKTTIARLSSPAGVLNDDLVLLLPQTAGWQANATPFWNPTQTRPGSAQSGGIAGLFKLVHDQRVYTAPLSGARALAEVIASAPIVSADPGRAAALLKRCSEILETVPCFALHFRREPGFWEAVHRAVS